MSVIQIYNSIYEHSQLYCVLFERIVNLGENDTKYPRILNKLKVSPFNAVHSIDNIIHNRNNA